jgi:4-hydroxybenzoate-CoA ligase
VDQNQNAALYFVDRHITEGRGDKTAFREADGAKRSLSYGRLAEESARFAGALGRHGVRREERIAMIVRDQIEFPVVFWGAIKAGAIPVPLNTLLSSDVYDTILNDSRASILVVSEALWDVVKPAVEDNRFLRAVVVIGDAPEGTKSYTEFVKDAPMLDAVEANDDELAFWLYSSGSTGTPKGVRHVHSSLKATVDTFGNQVLGIREDDVVFSAAKMFFAYGLGNAISFPMAVGATTVIFSGRPTPAAMFDIMAREKPTVFCGVPTLFAALVAEQEKAGGKPEHCVRICTSAGEALPRDVGERWEKL